MRALLGLGLFGMLVGCDGFDLTEGQNEARPQLSLLAPRAGAQVTSTGLVIRARVSDSDTTEKMTVSAYSDRDGLLCTGGVEERLTGGASFQCEVDVVTIGEHIIRVVAEDHGGRQDELTSPVTVVVGREARSI